MDIWNTTCGTDLTLQFAKDFASLFYLIPIQESIQNDHNSVPNYEVSLFPVISLLVLLEQLIRYYRNQELSRFEDCVINVGSAFIFTLVRVFLFVAVVGLFHSIYENYRLVDLPLHSGATWLLSLVLVEFVYYWTHRALHELNILWAAHQFHHMAEDINVTATVRDSIVDLIIYDIFPIPLALLIPPQILAIHIQFSLIYQVWLHNEVIGHLGPLEYLVNTPRQHRVHHGKNPYCIDKNYGAFLMIFDRMFGTYQEEDPKEKIVFGCVSPTPETFDHLILQFGYYKDVWNKFLEVKGLGNKLSALVKGPGWSPGKPRLGLISDVPQPDPNAPKYTYTPNIALWKKCYVYVHGFIIVIGFYLMADHHLIKFTPWRGFLCMLYIIVTLSSFGTLFDLRWFAVWIEIVRCLIYFTFDYFLIESQDWALSSNLATILQFGLWTIRTIHLVSIVFWLLFAVINLFSSQEFIEKDVEKQSNNFNDNKEDKKPNQFSLNTVITVVSLLVVSILVFALIYIFQVPSCALLVERIR